jgi:hypothetical protein
MWWTSSGFQRESNTVIWFRNLRAFISEFSKQVDSLSWHLILGRKRYRNHPSDAATRHLFAVEHAVYHMRRAADELIGLRAVVSYYAESDEWSDSVDPDCVGRLLAREDLCALEPHRDRRELLTRLNDLHNARKHSFLNTDTALIGRDEPTANAIHRRETEETLLWRYTVFR